MTIKHKTQARLQDCREKQRLVKLQDLDFVELQNLPVITG